MLAVTAGLHSMHILYSFTLHQSQNQSSSSFQTLWSWSCCKHFILRLCPPAPLDLCSKSHSQGLSAATRHHSPWDHQEGEISGSHSPHFQQLEMFLQFLASSKATLSQSPIQMILQSLLISIQVLIQKTFREKSQHHLAILPLTPI